MSGFDGAFICTAGKDPIRPIMKARSSYLTCEADRLVETMATAIMRGRNPDGSRKLNKLAGFLNNADVNDTYAITAEAPAGSDPFGMTLVHRQGEPGTAGAQLTEYEARQVKFVFRKTDPNGGFELYNIYPTPMTVEGDIGEQHGQTTTPQYAERATHPDELRQKLEDSPTYQAMSPTERVMWQEKTKSDRNSPDMSLHEMGGQTYMVLQFPQAKARDTRIGINEDSVWTKGPDGQTKRGNDALRDINRCRVRGTVDRMRRDIRFEAGRGKDLEASEQKDLSAIRQTSPQTRRQASDDMQY